MLLSFAGFACSRYDTNPAEVPGPPHDEALASASADATGKAATQQVVLAGGCFWCVEAVYEQLDGILDVESGYAGGTADTANYKAVSSGTTGHAEVVRSTYDPSKITYGTILKVFFSTAHDPTTLNRQGADVGPQYRSAIFYDTPEHKQIAQDYIAHLNKLGVYSNPIVTTLEPLITFYPAETYHQDFARENPDHGYINAVSDPKVKKTKEAFPEMLRGNSKTE